MSISLQLQSCPAWGPQFIERSGVEWIKWVDPPEQGYLVRASLDGSDEELREVRAALAVVRAATVGELKIIGRTYEPDGVSNGRVWQGANGAKSWFNQWLPFYASRPWVHCWEGPNEPQPMRDQAFRARLNDFTVELARLMHGAGLRLVGMNWGVGWPDIGHAPEMGQGVQACDYLGLHEYCAPAMWDGDGWYTLRYRRTVQELTQAGYIVPPIIIGECGIDGGVLVPPQPKTGWRTHCASREEYVRQLGWYSWELDQDAIVQAATIFTVCDFDWFDFRVDEALAMDLAGCIAST